MMVTVGENGLYLTLRAGEDGGVRLTHGSCRPEAGGRRNTRVERWQRLVELQASGFNQDDHHGGKHTGCSPSDRLRYAGHTDARNVYGRKLEILQAYAGLEVTTHLQLYDGIPVIRSWNVLVNRSGEEWPVEYVSSLALVGLSENYPVNSGDVVHIPHNTWYGEARWQSYTLHEAGYDSVNSFSMKRIACSNTGSWACKEYLPMGGYTCEALDKTLLWQIETSGSWHWELSDIADSLYLQASGPTYAESGWMRRLKPGERFETVPCALAMTPGGFDAAVQAMTRYRRVIRRDNRDNKKLPVIFNDYMNCLMGNPTTEALLPLIDAAAAAGCEYFCIDCGWYDDGDWWDGVGRWLPSPRRFPRGIEEPLQRIREKGMIPGLWLEIEVMGITCPLAEQAGDDWFFQRHGRRVIDHSRYQLDFRNPAVRDYATAVVRRLVEQYGVGYIKMDYNIDSGTGTDYKADSAGDGLLQHTRDYLAWIDELFLLWPELVIENCSSGGMRMEYSLLSRHSLQSVTDQTDYLKMAVIAANCMTACTPEQAAIWSYPLLDGTAEETVFNMVNALLLRVHQSGHLAELGAVRANLVREGIAVYRQIRADIPKALPFWPVGLASMTGEWACVGLDCPGRQYVAVWRLRGGESDMLSIPLPKGKHAVCLYPRFMSCPYQWQDGTLTVRLPAATARLFEIAKS